MGTFLPPMFLVSTVIDVRTVLSLQVKLYQYAVACINWLISNSLKIGVWLIMRVQMKMMPTTIEIRPKNDEALATARQSSSSFRPSRKKTQYFYQLFSIIKQQRNWPSHEFCTPLRADGDLSRLSSRAMFMWQDDNPMMGDEDTIDEAQSPALDVTIVVCASIIRFCQENNEVGAG